ncbi:MAG: hypothetical protein ACAH80_05675 [Alphaproteobacteria bacterium]
MANPILRRALPVFLCGLLLPLVAIAAPKAGDTYEITQKTSSSYKSDGSSGSSGGGGMIVEKVIALRDGGVELEYDLPKDTPAKARERQWQFPARVFKPSEGALQLLNAPELEARVDIWLKAAKLERAACGRMIFTWNAFRIECDPQSVLKKIDMFDLGPDRLDEGAPYSDPDALEPAKLAKKINGLDDIVFSAEMPVNPAAVRRARAEADVATGELMRKPVSLEDALEAREKEAVSGTVSVEFATDSDGIVNRRTKVTKIEIKEDDGKTEARTSKETLERRFISAP